MLQSLGNTSCCLNILIFDLICLQLFFASGGEKPSRLFAWSIYSDVCCWWITFCPQKRLRNAKEFDKHLQRSGKGGGWCKFRCHTDTNLPVTCWHLPVPKGLQLMHSAIISATSISTCSDDFQHESCQCGSSIKTWNATCNSIPKLRCQTWNFHAMLQAHGISRYCQRSRRFAVFWFFLYLSIFLLVGTTLLSTPRVFQLFCFQDFFSPIPWSWHFDSLAVPFVKLEICCQRCLLSYSGSLKS